MGEYVEHEGALDATGMRIAIVAGRFNDHVTKPLLEGALAALHGIGLDAVPVHWVPGAFEIPLVAQRLAASGAFDAVVCLGAVIRGDTPHFDFVAGSARPGSPACRSTPAYPWSSACSPPTTSTRPSPAAAGPSGTPREASGNKGEESASTAVEMVDLLRQLPPKGK